MQIAIGKSRKDKSWKNKEFTWIEFLEKIKKTHRTPEKIKDYLSFDKDRQSEIKDIGGFVGGTITGGRRTIGSILSRQLLTFDVDEASIDFWDRFTLQYDCDAAVYSTHKHTPEKPRLRLLIPLSREIFSDEYSAIVRRMAADLGMEMFDHTGFQFIRLMYWPSTSIDAEYYFKQQQGKLLDPDLILSTYSNWQDISEWPVHPNEKKDLKSHGNKQGEPTEKPGLIGAFNRAYGISEAITKFIPEVYEKSAVKDRYTFKKGTTAAGAVVYGNKFLYSHHSTDPACEILCNAFDLIRIHKFGIQDEEVEEGTPINKYPSFISMCDFVASDKEVKKQIGEAKLESAKTAFDEVVSEDELDWLKEMDVDRKSNYLVTINNIALILEHDPIFKNNLLFDEFKQQVIFKNKVPWRRVDINPTLTDRDFDNIENYIEKVYKITSGNKFLKGLSVVCEKNKFHPVVNYLKGLKWDGIERVETLLVDYLGAENSHYVREVTKKTLVAAVARIYKPGIKFDTVLTTVGDEGQGKSQLWDRLGGDWFSDTFNFHMLQTKEGYEQIQGIWIVEIGELSGMARTESERVKNFIAARKDNYRSPWGRTTEKRSRQNIFVAGVNGWDFLKSQTGNRRFWPVATYVGQPLKDVHSISDEERDQLWAEAVMLFNKGEKLYLDKETEQQAFLIQEQHTEENPWVEIFENFLAYKIPENWWELSKYDKIDFIRNYKEDDKLVDRDRTCKYELWEVALEQREVLNIQGLKMLKQAMRKLKDWVTTEGSMRFGTSYPRHRGSYVKKITIEQLL